VGQKLMILLIEVLMIFVLARFVIMRGRSSIIDVFAATSHTLL
jgi:hypothetical protein